MSDAPLKELPPELVNDGPEDVIYLLDLLANSTGDEITLSRDDALRLAQYVADLRLQRENAIRGWQRCLAGWHRALEVST
jgi:hypothetical protein